MLKVSLIAVAAVLAAPWQSSFAQKTPTFKSLYAFGGSSGRSQAAPVIGPDGVLYGTRQYELYELKPPSSPSGQWKEHVLHVFPETSGGYETMPLAVGANGELYGTTTFDGSCAAYGHCGTVFMLTPPAAAGDKWTYTVVYTFAGPPDGAFPGAGVIVGPDGTLYGTAGGGTGSCNQGCGIVFSLTPPASLGGAWVEDILYNFSPGGGDGVVAKLAMSGDGALYGALNEGGLGSCLGGGCGAVFSLVPPTIPGGAWTETLLYRFSGGADGGSPEYVVLGSDGTLYGTTSVGGTTGMAQFSS